MPPETEAFLVELARAAQRLGLYPPGHPVVAEMVASTGEQLAAVLASTPAFTIDVSRDHLTVGEDSSSPDHTLLHALARRFYRHLVYQLTFRQGVEPFEIQEFLTAISVKPGIQAECLGSGSDEELARWPHIAIDVIPFSALTLAEDEVEEASIFGDSLEPGEVLHQAKQQLSNLNLNKLTEVLENADQSDPATLHEGISQMIVGMAPDTMRTLVKRLPEDFQQSAAESTVEGAIAEIMEAADSGSPDNASGALLRLMTKLALLNEDPEAPDSPASPESDQQLVALLQRLGKGWEVENPNPEEYDETLRTFNQTAQQLAVDLKWSDEPDAERILQISLEIDETAPPTLKATADMITSGKTGSLMDLLEGAPAEVETTGNLWQRVDRKDTVVNVLDFQPVDYSTLDRVITRIWEEAAGPMLDRLLVSDYRMERISLLERLERLDSDIGPAIMERLGDGPWYHLRNLINLLGRLSVLPGEFEPWIYLDHTDPRVRREAYSIALNRDIFRGQALHHALNDSDPMVLEQALDSLQNKCPKELIPYLVAMINDPDCLTRIKTACIRSLANSNTEEAFEVLLSLVWQRKWLIFFSLAPKSAMMMAALSALKSWRQETRAIKVLQSALRSSDPQIQTVARTASSGA